MQKEWVALAIRIFAVFVFIYGSNMMIQAISFIQMYKAYPETGSSIIIFSWIIAFIPLPVALVMWFFPMTLAGRLMPKKEESSLTESMSFNTLQQTILIVLGLFLLAYSVPDMIYWITYLAVLLNSPAGEYGIDSNSIANIVTTILEVLLGIVLVFGSDFMQRLIRKFQRIGLENK